MRVKTEKDELYFSMSHEEERVGFACCRVGAKFARRTLSDSIPMRGKYSTFHSKLVDPYGHPRCNFYTQNMLTRSSTHIFLKKKAFERVFTHRRPSQGLS